MRPKPLPIQEILIILDRKIKSSKTILDFHSLTNLSDPRSTFEIESLSILLDVTLRSFASCKPSLVKLTGTRIDHDSNAIGTKILSL